MLTIRPLEPSDLPAAERLSTVAGWNQTAADWQRFLRLAPAGCFTAINDKDAAVCGTVTTCSFGQVAWIGMMLVDPDMRRQGIGSKLMQSALDYLDDRGTRTVRLDATPLGQPLYEQLGFAAQFKVIRYMGQPSVPAAAIHLAPVDPDTIEPIVALDEAAVGYPRGPLLAALAEQAEASSVVHQIGARLGGFGLTRPGRLARFLGPCVAAERESGQWLLTRMMAAHAGGPVVLDVPEWNRAATETVRQAGLSPVREFVRMCRGDTVSEHVEMVFASSGPEKG